jgi:signal transduction histidine kinase/DNA-binding response OmpR family regulator
MEEAPEAPRAAPAPSWLGLLSLKGLGAKLVLAQILVAVLLLGTALLARQDAQAAQARLLHVYDHRIFPLHRLSQLADSLAIDFVDTVHKVSDGSLGEAEGAKRLEHVHHEADQVWREAASLMNEPGERGDLDEIGPVLAEAQEALLRAQAMMSEGEHARLIGFRQSELYTRVDPLTARLQRQIAAALTRAQLELLTLRHDLQTSALKSTLALGGVGLLAIVAGLFVASRFLVSLRRVERVVEAAAGGDLTQRIELPGSDELSVMATRIDAMIGAILKSQTALSEQAQALARSEAEARAASSAKSAFLGNVSHELRTPLNVILGYAQALAREPGLKFEVSHGLNRIEEAGNHLLQLIEDVIGAARLDQTSISIRLGAFAPEKLLANLELMLGQRARSKSLAFEVTSVGPVPRSVTGDRRRLLQVLLNLAGNAVKFTQRGGVFVYMSWRDERLRFEVKDTGPGIPEAEQKTLFQTFSQGSLGRKSGEGTGLGLHISRGIARALGGDLTLESVPGHGATFVCEVEAPEAAPEEDGAFERVGLRAPPDHGLAPMLIVDDRPANREVLAALLRVTGFDAVEAADGEAALRHLETGATTSLVWLDMKMPGLDGNQVLRRIRQREHELSLSRTPVVLITASVVDLDGPGARALGFDDWVPKPFRAEAVLEVIQRLTGVKLQREHRPGVGSDAPPRPPAFDVQTLAATDRAQLLELLTVGDISAAADWARRLGPVAQALVAEIQSFRTDALLASLKRPKLVPGSEGAASR